MKFFFLATGLIFIAACSNHKESPASNEPKPADKQEHTMKAGELSLNNGMKWKADRNTSYNVKYLQVLLENFNTTDKSVYSYKKLGTKLQAGLDKMIIECRMKGADHEALHKWLEPLVGQVKKLNEAETSEESAQQLTTIAQQIQLYSQLFEY